MRESICLVRPPTLATVTDFGQDGVPPVGLAYIAGALAERGHRFRAVDAVGEAVHQYTRVTAHPNALLRGLTTDQIIARMPSDAEVIGITSMFSLEWLVVRDLTKSIRRAFPKALIVLGGEHVTACPEYVLKDCPAADACVLGEGEETFLELLEAPRLSQVAGLAYRENGAVVRTPARPRVRDVDGIAAPDWSAFPTEQYIDNALTYGTNLGRSMPLIASRGCPYLCTFCSSPSMWTTLWRARKPELVVAEMEKYLRRYRATNFDFYDLTAIVNRDWILRFCRLLVEKDLDITWQLPSGTRSVAIDEEVSRWLYRSGCRHINYAPESGSEEELSRIKKRVNIERMLSSMRGARRAGMAIKANIILGLPGSGWRDVAKTFVFLARLAWVGVDDLSCFPYSAYPGSELFRCLEKSGRITLGESYFKSFLAYADPKYGVSYVDFLSSRQLSRLALAGMIWFYALAFLRRPWRAAALAADLIRRRQASKLTMVLGHWKRRRLALAEARSRGVQTVVIPPLFQPQARAR